MKPLTPRERRLVAVAILLGLLAIAWLGVIAPLAGGFAARAEERRGLLDAYSRNARTIERTAVFRADLDRQRQDAQRFRIAAASRREAADALGRRATRTITDAGGIVESQQAVDAGVAEGWASVRLDGRLTLPQVHEALRRLQSEEPYVTVDYLSVGADRPFVRGGPNGLAVRLQVSARFAGAQAR